MGTLAFLNRAASASGVLFGYSVITGESAFTTATLRLYDVATGAVVSSAIVVGTNWVASVPTGRYVGIVDEYDALGALIRRSNPVLISITDTDIDDTSLVFSWAGDERAWETRLIDPSSLRRSVNINESCHRLRWKLECLGQNVRTTIRSVNYHLRQRGRSESAEER